MKTSKILYVGGNAHVAAVHRQDGTFLWKTKLTAWLVVVGLALLGREFRWQRIRTRRLPRSALLLAALGALAAGVTAQAGAGPGTARDAGNPYVGGWALTLPGGWPAWLGVEEERGQLRASWVWMDGTFGPLAEARLADGTLVMTRRLPAPDIIETITASADGDTLELVKVTPGPNGQGETKFAFVGHRLPPLPPAPDLARVRFGAPILLFNGRDLSGWRLSSAAAEAFHARAGHLRDRSGQPLAYPTGENGWRARDGLLVNDPRQDEGKPYKAYGNLRTDREFEDFRLTLEVRVPKQGLSGVFLRGVYEVQVADSQGRLLRSNSMGGVYSRLTPTVAAEQPSGAWQTLDLTLVDRHVTVVLNGTKIIDNQPVPGSTPWALWSDVTRPGPVYLRGDQTGVEYRNLVLRPVIP